MRELKFRVWSFNDNKYIDQFAPDFVGLAFNYLINNKYYNVDKKEFEKEFCFQQFTGLKDSEGRDIYEGDIVQARDHYDDTYFTGKVVFSKELASFVFASEKAEYYVTSYDLLVIGNIFENKDLLKKT